MFSDLPPLDEVQTLSEWKVSVVQVRLSGPFRPQVKTADVLPTAGCFLSAPFVRILLFSTRSWAELWFFQLSASTQMHHGANQLMWRQTSCFLRAMAPASNQLKGVRLKLARLLIII